MRKYCILLLCALLCAGLLSGCGCEHDWNAENCGPVTCNLCGKESDVVREHIWEKATCLLPQTCYNCGGTQGTALGHSWVEASCTAPKTCTACAVTEGEPLGHGETLWVFAADLGMRGTEESGTCPTCGESMGNRICPMASFVSEGRFTFSPQQFLQYLNDCHNADKTVEIQLTEEDEMKLSCTKDGALSGYAQFYKEGALVTFDRKDEIGVDKLAFYAPFSTSAGAQMTQLLGCCDPANYGASDDPAAALYRELMDGFNSTKEDRFTAERNGVSYCFAPFQDDGQIWYYIEVTPVQ